MKLKLEKLNKSYSVITNTKRNIGSFQLDSNGFYYFWENSGVSGYWDSHTLREIAFLLDEVNKPYREEFIEYCSSKEEVSIDIF